MSEIQAIDLTRGWNIDQYDPQCGNTVQFSVNISNNKIKKIKWDLGDGTISTEIQPMHVFVQNGTTNPTVGKFKVKVSLTFKNNQNQKQKLKLTRKILVCPRALCEIQAEMMPLLLPDTTNIDFAAQPLCEETYAGPDNTIEYETVCTPVIVVKLKPTQYPAERQTFLSDIRSIKQTNQTKCLPCRNLTRGFGLPITKIGLYRLSSSCRVRSAETNIFNKGRYAPTEKIFNICPQPDDLSITPTSVTLGQSTTLLIVGLSSSLLPIGSVIEWLISGISVKISNDNSITLNHIFNQLGEITVDAKLILPGCFNHKITQVITIEI